MFEIKVPEFGESITEVQVASWMKQPGDWIDRDEDIVELESEKASQALASDQAGVLSEIKVQEGEFAKVGDVLCVLKTGEKPASGSSSSASATVGGSSTAVVDAPPETADWIMPAAERVLSEYQISADAIKPTGPGGRLLKEDVLNYVQQKGLKPGLQKDTPPQSQAAAPAAPAPAPRPKPKPAEPAASTPRPWGADSHHESREEKAVPMSMIRRTIICSVAVATLAVAQVSWAGTVIRGSVLDSNNQPVAG